MLNILSNPRAQFKLPFLSLLYPREEETLIHISEEYSIVKRRALGKWGEKIKSFFYLVVTLGIPVPLSSHPLWVLLVSYQGPLNTGAAMPWLL